MQVERGTVRIASVALLAVMLLPGASIARDEPAPRTKITPRSAEAVAKALAALRSAQSSDGHWDDPGFPVTVTAMSTLALLSGSDDVRDDAALRRAVVWLHGQVDADGRAPQEGHTWIHVQGFVTLALAEASARAIRCEPRLDIGVDLPALEATLRRCVTAIESAQSPIGGWWYTAGAAEHQHEGSTTVCAVQALRAARNAGIPVRGEVLERGFEYLKRSQVEDGGFQYNLGQGGGMLEGTAADVATLALMDKLDYPVLVKGARRLVELGAEPMASGHHAEYGQLYAALGAKLVAEEMGEAVPGLVAYGDRITALLLEHQRDDGRWASSGWMGDTHPTYATAMATLALAIPAERLTIFRRGG